MGIGIIGGGAIAPFLLKKLNENDGLSLRVRSIYVRDVQKYKTLEKRFNVTLFDQLDDFLQSNIHTVVEAANIEAAKATIPTVIKYKHVVLISIGALADNHFYKQLCTKATKYARSIYLPSGGIGGLDLLQSANALGEVDKVSLTTRKPAHSLTEKDLLEAEMIFSGVAKDAIEKFPENINVSIILSIAGIGMEKTEVHIIADPTIHKNKHTIELKGEFGKAKLSIENTPLLSNPKTSELAALSIIHVLKNQANAIKIGG